MSNVHGIKVTGGSYPARIWKAFMQPSVAIRRAPSGAASTTTTQAPAGDLPSEVLVSICPDSMLRATKRCPAPIDIYLDPTRIPTQTCNRH